MAIYGHTVIHFSPSPSLPLSLPPSPLPSPLPSSLPSSLPSPLPFPPPSPPLLLIVPDLSQLDPKVVQLLAVQRLQQLLSPKPPLQTPKADPDPNHRLQTDTAAPQLNGWTEPSEDAPIKHHRDSMKGALIRFASTGLMV